MIFGIDDYSIEDQHKTYCIRMFQSAVSLARALMVYIPASNLALATVGNRISLSYATETMHG